MRKLLLVVPAVLLAVGPNSVFAVEIAALDFTGGGSAWNVTGETYEPMADTLPIIYEKDGDPTKVGFEFISPFGSPEGLGLYSLTQQIFAPAGMAMTNIRLTALGSGFSSWIMDGRVGFGLEENIAPLEYEYGVSANTGNLGTGGENNGLVVVDYVIDIDSTGDPDFPATPSIWVSVEIVKQLELVAHNADISQIVIEADLTAIPDGDFNGDLRVDGNDFLAWQRGGSPDPLSATDLADWETNYGTVAALSASIASVPEPSTGILFIGSAVLALAFRRGRAALAGRRRQ